MNGILHPIIIVWPQMSNPRDFGPVYWHLLWYKVKPPVLWEKAITQEIEDKYRGGIGLSIRIPFTRLAIVIGRWKESFEESQALTNAIAGRAVAEEEINWDRIRYGLKDEEK